MAEGPDRRNGIVLAMFGTSIEQGLPGLLHIRDRMAAGFPRSPVRIAFTSKIIRRIWQERAVDPDYRKLHPEVPEDILHVQSTREVIRKLQEEGVDSFVVQPVHIAPAGRGGDTGSSGNVTDPARTAGAGLAPGGRIVFGRPALGGYGPASSSADDLAAAAGSLFRDAALARKEGAALFYMGHGNKKHATGKVYCELVAEMRRQYPDITTVISLVEEESSFDETVAELKKQNIEKIVLKPFMIVAGSHVGKDMAGSRPDSLQSRLEAEGFTVVPVLKGLGEEDEFADIFVRHAADAARDAGIDLR
ncbi:MAG: sirohydrochlorin cobaltochelatase [Desulfobulbaceae bacterium]|nr:sirohydrochlorin cobaltochelatase [Desulfobulbaceae bacterium]